MQAEEDYERDYMWQLSEEERIAKEKADELRARLDAEGRMREENERAAADPLVRVIFRAKCSLGKNRENVSISRRKMTRTKGSDAARSFSTSSSRSDILLLSEM